MMTPPRDIPPYDLLLREVTAALFKPTVPEREGLSALEKYVKADYSYGSIKPLTLTWSFKTKVQKAHHPLTTSLEQLHLQQEEQRGRPLLLEDVVAVAYQQENSFDQRAVLLLGYEFGFYTITQDVNAQYYIGDTKQSIVTLVPILERAKQRGIAADAVMNFVYSQYALMNSDDQEGTFALPNDDDAIFEFGGLEEDTEELGLLSPTVLAPLYETGIRALLREDTATINQIGRSNSAQLRDARYRKHIALALRGAYAAQVPIVPQAIRYYEESLALTPDTETHEPLYAATISRLFELYCSHAFVYTLKIPNLYARAKTTGVSLDEDVLSTHITSFADRTVGVYLRAPSPTSLLHLDALLPLTELPPVQQKLCEAYTTILRKALDDKNIDYAKHCRDKLATLSAAIPFEEEVQDGIYYKILDALLLHYQYAALQYDVGAVADAAEALPACKRLSGTSGAGALHLLTAKIRLAQGDTDAALVSLEAAVGADFSDARFNAGKEEAFPLLIELGRRYHDAGQTEYAQTAFRNAIVLDPKQAKQIGKEYHAQAKQYTDKKGVTSPAEYQQAQALLEMAVILGEATSWVHYRLGKCYQGLERLNDAKRQFELVLSQADKETNVCRYACNKLTTLK